MAEYIRFVSYLYDYQGNERKKNVGFVRYEVRGGLKRLTVSVNGLDTVEGKPSVYVFYRDMNSCIGVELGTLIVKNGRGTFQYSTYADGPQNASECTFEDVAGVVVEGKNIFFACVWDDEPMQPSLFVRSRQEFAGGSEFNKEKRAQGKDNIETKSEYTGTDENSDAADDISRENFTAKSEYTYSENLEASVFNSREGSAEKSDINAMENISNSVEYTDKESEYVDPAETNTQAIEGYGGQAIASDEVKVKDIRERNIIDNNPDNHESRSQRGFFDNENSGMGSTAGYEVYRQTAWDRLCKLYPKVMPFPYDYRISCLRIRPNDIGRLPKCNWNMARNSFMLHSFFQYRYILLVKLPAANEEYEERYLLGVPGTYDGMNKHLADSFGFKEFMGSPKAVLSDGQFGYYLQEVTMECEG